MARAFFVKYIIMNATINDAFAKFIGIRIVQAIPIKVGRTTALYNVSVVEKESGVLLANFQGTAFRIK